MFADGRRRGERTSTRCLCSCRKTSGVGAKEQRMKHRFSLMSSTSQVSTERQRTNIVRSHIVDVETTRRCSSSSPLTQGCPWKSKRDEKEILLLVRCRRRPGSSAKEENDEEEHDAPPRSVSATSVKRQHERGGAQCSSSFGVGNTRLVGVEGHRQHCWAVMTDIWVSLTQRGSATTLICSVEALVGPSKPLIGSPLRVERRVGGRSQPSFGSRSVCWPRWLAGRVS